MKLVFHPKFAQDVKKFASQYGGISANLEQRFRSEVSSSLSRIESSPESAGHFVDTGSRIVKEVRRRNLSSFPFFILYGIESDLIVIGSLIPSASDPLTWLNRF